MRPDLKLYVVFLIVLSGFFIRGRNKALRKQQRKLKRTVQERTKELLFLNASLQGKNEEISHQSDELRAQKENLLESNRLLEENKQQVDEQKKELEKHRYHLEELVH